MLYYKIQSRVHKMIPSVLYTHTAERRLRMPGSRPQGPNFYSDSNPLTVPETSVMGSGMERPTVTAARWARLPNNDSFPRGLESTSMAEPTKSWDPSS